MDLQDTGSVSGAFSILMIKSHIFPVTLLLTHHNHGMTNQFLRALPGTPVPCLVPSPLSLVGHQGRDGQLELEKYRNGQPGSKPVFRHKPLALCASCSSILGQSWLGEALEVSRGS